jgi:hypothetical protein
MSSLEPLCRPTFEHSTDCTGCDFGHLLFTFLSLFLKYFWAYGRLNVLQKVTADAMLY